MVRRRAWPKLAGGVALASAAGLFALGCAGSTVADRTPSSAPTTSVPTTSVPPSSGTTTTVPVPPPPAPVSPALLRPGDTGPVVATLQARLAALGYWLGSPDGSYGLLTEEAVVALQKASGLSPDGVFGPLTAEALDRGVRPEPHSSTGRVVEVDIEHQLVLVVTDGRLEAVLDSSTGSGATYVQDGLTMVAVTPTGRFQIFRQVDGSDVSPLGVLWRPKYFNGGIALHGYSEVPPYPASHGCVRVSNAAMDWIWADDLAPIGTAVWVY